MPNTVPETGSSSGVDSQAPRKRVHVAVGVIADGAGNILLSRRAEDAHQGGLWEFPGGKVEIGEMVQQALHRELLEELAIAVRRCEPLLIIEHDYTDKLVLLDVWWVDAFDGEPHGREGQPLRWVGGGELRTLEFPKANAAIIDAVQLKLGLPGGS